MDRAVPSNSTCQDIKKPFGNKIVKRLPKNWEKTAKGGPSRRGAKREKKNGMYETLNINEQWCHWEIGKNALDRDCKNQKDSRTN